MDVCAQDQIVTLPALREIFSRVINDVVCANPSRRVHFARAAHGSDFGPERFGNLNRKRAHTTRRAINHNLLAWLDASFITETLKGGKCRHRYGCCVLKRTVGWLQRQFIFSSAHILGKPASCETFSPNPEYFVAWFELGYVAANRLNPPCYINSEDLVFWCAQSRDRAEQRRTSHLEQVQWIYRCRVKLY